MQVSRLATAANYELAIVKPVRPLIENIKNTRKRVSIAKEKGVKIEGTLAFPSPQCRYCTSEQKVQPMDKLMRTFTGKLLKVTGERWAESKARADLPEFCRVPRISTAKRTVYGWRPMLAWSEADIWAKIRETGVPRHRAYDLGCSRLGCAGCIFSGDHELKIEMRENPHIFEALDRLEIESGYTMGMNGKRIRDRIK